MKKQITFIVLLLIFCSSLSYGQSEQDNKYSDQFIENCIREVFQDKADELVFNRKSRYDSYLDLFKNRLRIDKTDMAKIEKAGYTKLSDVPLQKKYNANIRRDAGMNPTKINVLKYLCNFNPIGKPAIYHIDNTNYIIIVKPMSKGITLK